jgi:hypothetical protein
MRSSAQRAERFQVRRPAYRTVRGWALGVLLEAHAIRECDEHGHMKDRTDPHALDKLARLPAKSRSQEPPRSNPLPRWTKS